MPINLYVMKTERTAAVLTWLAPKKPRGIISKYEVVYWAMNGNEVSADVSPRRDQKNNITHTAHGLKEETQYFFKVCKIIRCYLVSTTLMLMIKQRHGFYLRLLPNIIKLKNKYI